MNLNRLTEKAQEAVLAAQQLAERAGNPQLEPEHLLTTLVEQRDGVVPALLARMSVEPRPWPPRCAANSARCRRPAAAHSPRCPPASARWPMPRKPRPSN